MLTAGDVLMVLATTILWASVDDLMYRLTAVCGVATLRGWHRGGTYVLDFCRIEWWNRAEQDPAQFWRLHGHDVFPAVVFVWLELAPIIPISRHAKSAATDAKE